MGEFQILSKNFAMPGTFDNDCDLQTHCSLDLHVKLSEHDFLSYLLHRNGHELISTVFNSNSTYDYFIGFFFYKRHQSDAFSQNCFCTCTCEYTTCQENSEYKLNVYSILVDLLLFLQNIWVYINFLKLSFS